MEGEGTPSQHGREDADRAMSNGSVTPRGSCLKPLIHLFLKANAMETSANVEVRQRIIIVLCARVCFVVVFCFLLCFFFVVVFCFLLLRFVFCC